MTAIEDQEDGLICIGCGVAFIDEKAPGYMRACEYCIKDCPDVIKGATYEE